MKRQFNMKVLSVLAIAAALVIGGSTAAATAAEPSSTSSTQVAPGTLLYHEVVPMTADCADLSQSARAYAVAHGLTICGLSGAQSSNSVAQPDSVATGDCGTSALWVYQGSGSGKMSIHYGFSSDEGPMVERLLDVVWDGAVHDGYFIDTYPMLSATYSNIVQETTGVGSASAAMEGSATTAWGLTCFMGSPGDARYIN